MTGGNTQEDESQEDSSANPPPATRSSPAPISDPQQLDDFGLPRKPVKARPPPDPDDSDGDVDSFHDAEAEAEADSVDPEQNDKSGGTKQTEAGTRNSNAIDTKRSDTVEPGPRGATNEAPKTTQMESSPIAPTNEKNIDSKQKLDKENAKNMPPLDTKAAVDSNDDAAVTSPASQRNSAISATVIPKRDQRTAAPAASEWSHQRQIAATDTSDGEEEEEEWQAMAALDEFDIYDDDGRLVAKGNREIEEEPAYIGLGGASKGYTRVQLDEDAQSATSMDEDTNYLFQTGAKPKEAEADPFDGEDEQRDAVTQLEATKDLLTEGQRIAYVGVVRLTVHKMFNALGAVEKTRSTRKELIRALENMDMWGQKIMVRLYTHMDINPAEQIMIEQLAEHGVEPSDLVAPLMLNARVDNPLADDSSISPERPEASPKRNSSTSTSSLKTDADSVQKIEAGGEVPQLQGPEDLPHTKQIELDLRWTVLCDLFLVLISDGQYDARSRRLLERVASTMKIGWLQICRFEKRVIDALEMQESEAQEHWEESDHMEKRRKRGLKRKYMVMGLATVGGGLVIGLSAGLLAPVIGAGLAAGFTTIGVTGTAGFLGGVGGAALITSAATAAGGTIAVRAADRRTGSVKTFEYRPLHNNKRLNLILTVSGWMNGKVDDVRLPYSTVDPIMGDIYSLLWEPEMLQSMGDTINILATEALTQTVQQVLGSTILVALMASIQLPVVLSKLAYLIDNPWSVSLDRANAAGLILADSLIDRHLGQRPITLLGFSLGSRVIFSCLRELSNRGAYGLIQNVYLFGSPVVAKKDEYLRARSVVAGRFLNGYNSNDWILGYLFRATSGGIMRVSGLAPVEGIPGLENVDVSSMVNGHMAYRAAMPRLLREVGWEVESDEFTEIEDPDPENHAKRQRELIQEIDDARKKAEEKPNKKRFGLFSRGKLAEKRGWETYDANNQRRSGSGTPEPAMSSDGNILFDIDAIRKELASEMIEVRELDSTLPPMQITSIQNGEKHVEYLRLPPEMAPEEVARLNLPPRPDEIDVSFNPPEPVRPARTSSLRPDSIASQHRSPRSSPQRSLQGSPDPSRRSSYNLSEPRELVSTLPPLTLTPSTSNLPRPDVSQPPSHMRPDLKTHATEPTVPSWGQPASMTDEGLTRPMTGLNLERNAWAENDDNRLGEHPREEISMTFE